MGALDFIADNTAKLQSYTKLCQARETLQSVIPPEYRAACNALMWLQAAKCPVGAGMPPLDAEIVLALQEITILLQCMAEVLEFKHQEPGAAPARSSSTDS